MRIALDAMGGDHAPREIVLGAVEALRTVAAGEWREFCPKDLEILLVGQEEAITDLIREFAAGDLPLRIVPANEVIGMDESPVLALRRKKGASILIASDLVRDGVAQAVVGAGSTGAQMAAGLLRIGRIQGIHRPAIATFMPTLKGASIVLDVGASPEVEAQNLVDYGVMGSIYASKVLGKERPSVGLLNMGEEPGKGGEVHIQAYKALGEVGINFIGNIEGRDVSAGKADVVVCDGFTGNIVLKFAEGLASALFGMMKEEFTAGLRTKVGAALLKPGLRKIKARMDYTEYGGAPLLGVEGISIIAHGSSNAKAIKSAIRAAIRAVNGQVVQEIRERLRKDG